MTGKQRYLATLAGEPIDHLARLPILMRWAADYISAPYGEFCQGALVKADANIRCANEYGLDVVSVMSDPFSETEAFGGDIVFHDDATPECPHPPLAETRDLATLKRPDSHNSRRLANTLKTVRLYAVAAERGEHAASILGWVEGPAAEAADLRGVSQFLLDLMDDPAWCGELMDRCVDVAAEFAAAQCEAGADTIGIGDAICSQVSPALYIQWVLPRQKKLCQAIKATGAIVRMHICGNITHLLPGLATLPLDILDVDHMVDIAAVRRAMPERVALVCNIDPVADVLEGTPESIPAAVRKRYEQAGDPFFVGAGCEIPPGTPPGNLRALCRPLRGKS